MIPNSATLKIDGMHCDACVLRVRAALSGVDGIEVMDVKIGSAEIAIDPAKTEIGAAVHAVNDIGYAAEIATA